MNRAIKPALAALSVAVAVGPVAAAGAARKSTPRVLRESYAPNPYEGIVISPVGPGVSVTSVPVTLQPSETLVSVKIADDSGAPVYGSVYQRGTVSAGFCGRTDRPVAVDPSKELTIEIFVAPCYGDVSVPTEGTVEVKIFSR